MTFKVSKSILGLKKANNLGKVGDSHDFKSKWINLRAKKGKKFGQIRGYLCVTFKVSESNLGLRKAKNLGKIGVSNGFQVCENMECESNLGLKKAKQLGKIWVCNGFQI